MQWRELQRRIDSVGVVVDQAAAQRPIVYVDSGAQTLSQIAPDDEVIAQYAVSTSRFGLGQQRDSYRTPAGIHCIGAKIGANEPAGRVFKGRQPTEAICLPDDPDTSNEDVITSRILWLEGLEPGVNRGGEVDSRQRYIYIHGTADEAHVGQPASIGCVRMRNDDVIALFDHVEPGDLVVID